MCTTAQVWYIIHLGSNLAAQLAQAKLFYLNKWSGLTQADIIQNTSLVGPYQHPTCAGILQPDQCFELAARFDARLAGCLLHIFVKRKLTAADDNPPLLPGGNIAKGIFLWHYKSQGIGESSYDTNKHTQGKVSLALL